MLYLHPVKECDVVVDRADKAQGLLHPPPRWVGGVARGLGGEVVEEAGDGVVQEPTHPHLLGRACVLSTPAACMAVAKGDAAVAQGGTAAGQGGTAVAQGW